MKKIIPFLVFCLVATCNADLRTWTAVNGKEVEAEFVSNEEGVVKLKLKSGKVFEVPTNKLSKEDNEFISSLSKPDGINVDELKEVEGIMWLKGPDIPYTGKVFGLYPNGQKEYETVFLMGEENGKDTAWYADGSKKEEGNWMNGKRDGIWVKWFQNGQKKMQGHFKDGKEDGLQTRWYENGQKKNEANIKDGKLDGLWSEWHENGQKKRETTFKIGKRVGLWLEWYDNGQMKKEINYKDGEEVEGSAKYWNRKGEPVDSLEEAQK